MRQLFIALVVIAIVGFGAYYALQGGGDLTYTAAVAEDNAILLVDQPLQSDEYVVSYAKLSEPGYVVIYATDPVTGATEIAGVSALLTAGEHANVKVTRRSRGGTNERLARMLRASIVADNGDGMFNADTDTQILEDGVESEAVESETAADPEDLSAEEIADLLEEAGYTVGNDATERLEDAAAESAMESPADDTIMEKDGEMMDGEGIENGETDDATEENPDDAGAMEDDSTMEKNEEETR